MNIDTLLISSLSTLSECEGIDIENIINSKSQKIPFGNVAFIKEKYWRNSLSYKESASKRKSHPGLSISSESNLVIFGSSQLRNRDKNNKNYFFVNHNECPILNKNVVFVFDTFISATINMIDITKTYYEPLCERKMKELKNAGYR